MCENDVINFKHKTSKQNIQIHNISHKSFQVIHSDSDDILLDTGESINIIQNPKFFSNLNKSHESENIFLEMADGTKSTNIIKGNGTAKIPIFDIPGTRYNLTLKEALYVPSFKKNIISVNRAIKAG